VRRKSECTLYTLSYLLRLFFFFHLIFSLNIGSVTGAERLFFLFISLDPPPGREVPELTSSEPVDPFPSESWVS